MRKRPVCLNHNIRSSSISAAVRSRGVTPLPQRVSQYSAPPTAGAAPAGLNGSRRYSAPAIITSHSSRELHDPRSMPRRISQLTRQLESNRKRSGCRETSSAAASRTQPPLPSSARVGVSWTRRPASECRSAVVRPMCVGRAARRVEREISLCKRRDSGRAERRTPPSPTAARPPAGCAAGEACWHRVARRLLHLQLRRVVQVLPEGALAERLRSRASSR
jgi:hypothetical protein